MPDRADARVFFALWPDSELRARLQACSLSLPLQAGAARRVPACNLHLTLQFIGNVDRAQLHCLRLQARRLRAAAFDLSLDRCGYFKKPKVAWLGCSRIPPGLNKLQQELGDRLQACDYQAEQRVYHPHVTIARKLPSAPQAQCIETLCWPVDSFVLLQSKAVDNGVIYQLVENYPLT